MTDRWSVIAFFTALAATVLVLLVGGGCGRGWLSLMAAAAAVVYATRRL